MKRTGTSTGTLAPSVFFITLIIFITSTLLAGAASARDRRGPAAGDGREGSAQKIPDRPKTPAPRPQPGARPDNKPVNMPVDRPVARPPRPRPDDRPREKYRPPKVVDRKDPPSGGTFNRKDPREHRKDPSPYDRFKKEKDMDTREKKDDGHCGGGVVPVLPPGIHPRPPWRPRPYPRPPVHCVTNIYFNTYIYQTVYIDGLIDDEVYGITLPFGPILPWEIGELFLIRLKYLEEEGLGGLMMTSIIQTNEEMGWEQFLARYQRDITDVMYYGRVGRTSFLVGMTVSDILDLMVSEGIRWVGEFYPEYKIVPGGRNSKFYVLSLEGDTIGFRRELRDAGVFVMGFDPDTQEYYVRSSQDTYDAVARLWWVARISGSNAEPFFQPEHEYLDVGMAP